jgi:hypothetical protein
MPGLRYLAHELVAFALIVEALVLESCLQFAFDEASGACGRLAIMTRLFIFTITPSL